METPFAHPKDTRYVDAARKLRMSRRAWFDACKMPVAEETATQWCTEVETRHIAYLVALNEIRAEEDRILSEERRVA
jgi:hypothetical protein